jgi:hypothetical protein
METSVFETTIFTTALILIGAGVLVKRFPMLIAGYNTMSDEEKANVDIKGLSSFICFSCVMMGIAPLLFYYICLWLGHADWAGMSLLLPVLYIPYLIVHANTYDHNKQRKHKVLYGISLLTVCLVAIIMLNGLRPTNVKYENGNISFTGMYGITKPINEITSISMADTLPEIALRINGLSVGGINKGRFKLRDGSSCNLFLSSSKPPYIVFTDFSGKNIYFNRTTQEKTMLVYKQLSPIFRHDR